MGEACACIYTYINIKIRQVYSNNQCRTDTGKYYVNDNLRREQVYKESALPS